MRPIILAAPVATVLISDPHDERSGPWFDSKDWDRLRELPPGTKLYAEPPTPTPAQAGQYVLCDPRVMAYAAFAPDGNIRMWCKSQVDAITAAGYEPFPLYAPAQLTGEGE